MTSHKPLLGKTALVTGGGTGIGLACATALRQAEAHVTITGRRADILARAAEDHDLTPCPMDVTDEASVVRAMEDTAEKTGHIDILIANAGIARGQNILGSDTAFWREIMATNLDGAYLTMREALRRMATDDWGRIIAISSIAGLRGLKGAHAYTASKHGLVGLIRGLAADFVGTGVTFNAICPGYVDTPIIGENVARITARTGMDDAAALKVMTDLNPHGRLIEPAEIAQAALWLCGPGSSSVTGTTIEISGGG